MTTPTARNVGSRGSTMAIACGTAIAAALGGMYLMGRDVKSKEGASSPYTNQGQGIGGGDKAMTSSDVNAAVSVPGLASGKGEGKSRSDVARDTGKGAEK